MSEQEFVNALSTRDLVVCVISNDVFFVLHLLICETASYFGHGEPRRKTMCSFTCDLY